MQRVKDFLKSKDPVKWLFYGDSITHGAYHTLGWRDYVELFAERVRFEMTRTSDIIINTAISGNTTRALLNGFDWRVSQFKPDVVFLMIGMNDCSSTNDITPEEFSKNLDKLAALIRNFGGLPVFQTTCPILPGTAPERYPHFPVFMDAVRNLAEVLGCPLIDHQKHWLENQAKHYYWMSNPFHPNEYGHRAFAFKLFRELEIFSEESNTCRLFLP